MRKPVFFFIMLFILLSGCAGESIVEAPALDADDASAESSVQATAQPVATFTPLPAASAARLIPPPDPDTGFIRELNFWESLTSGEDAPEKSLTLNTIEITAAYQSDTGRTSIQLNGTEAIDFFDSVHGGACCLAGGLYDLTGDGNAELVIRVRPLSSNAMEGDLHVFRVSEQIEEILTVHGRPAENVSEASAALLPLPDGFDYAKAQSVVSGISARCIGVNVISSAGIPPFLRLTHVLNETETAYTYVYWNGNAFEVFRQEIVPDAERRSENIRKSSPGAMEVKTNASLSGQAVRCAASYTKTAPDLGSYNTICSAAINVYDRASGDCVQQLQYDFPLDFLPDHIDGKLTALDIDGDGNDDLLLDLGNYGAHGTAYAACYLYRNGRYVLLPSFTSIQNPVVLPGSGTVLSSWRDDEAEYCYAKYELTADGDFAMTARLAETRSQDGTLSYTEERMIDGQFLIAQQDAKKSDLDSAYWFIDDPRRFAPAD